jgi:hypothetical protein
MAKAARYVIHKGLDPEYRKEVLGEEGDELKVDTDHSKDFTLPDASEEAISNEESDQAAQNSYFVLPNATLTGGLIEHGVDIHSKHGITTLFAEARGTAEDPTGTHRIMDQNILDPEETAKYLKAVQEGDRETIAELDGNERMLPNLYLTQENESSYRLENYDSVTKYNTGARPSAVEKFHLALSKLFPFEGGEEGSEPLILPTEDGAKLLDEKIIPEPNEDGEYLVDGEMNGYDHTTYADLFNKVSGKIKNGDRVIVDAEGGEFRVRGGEYSNSSLYAS